MASSAVFAPQTDSLPVLKEASSCKYLDRLYDVSISSGLVFDICTRQLLGATFPSQHPLTVGLGS